MAAASEESRTSSDGGSPGSTCSASVEAAESVATGGLVSFGLPCSGPPPRPARPRTIPREDLLTARDVARAFQLTYAPGEPAAKRSSESAAPGALRKVRLPSVEQVEEWNEAVNQHAAEIGRVAAICLLALVIVTAGVMYAVALGRAGHAALISLSTPSSNQHGPAPQAAATAVAPAPAVAAVAVAAPVAAPQPQAAPEVDRDPPDKVDDVRQLWMAALDAESRKQFAAAVKLYDHIQSLPSSCWPSGLATRVALAREELVAGTY